MQKILPNNKTSQLHQNIYTQQQNQKTPATKPRDVGQDKGSATQALPASVQPGSVNARSRAEYLKTKSPRSQNQSYTRAKLIHTTIWLKPLVRAELERIAKTENMSISQVGATACEDWVRFNIHRQQNALVETRLRHMIREELQAFGHRIVFFLMRIAFSAEQARILITNVLKLVLTLTGHDQKSYYGLVDESAKLAKRNIIRRTPQLKALLAEWEGSFPDPETQGKEEKTA